MALLSFHEVTKRYRDGPRQVAILDRVSLEIEDGDYVALWGPRRSGKSTLLRIAAGVEPPDEGAVCFDGQPLGRLSSRRRARLLRRRGIGLVVSDWRSHDSQRAVEHVAVPLMSAGLSIRGAQLLARRALEDVGAGDCADRPVGLLALSERIRVALAQALVREPRLLLVDEPALLPSPKDGDELYELLRGLGARKDLAVVIASEQPLALQGARRAMTISDGVVRSHERTGVVVPFPEHRTADDSAS